MTAGRLPPGTSASLGREDHWAPRRHVNPLPAMRVHRSGSSEAFPSYDNWPRGGRAPRDLTYRMASSLP
jgi:hypothetical protein